MIYIELLGNGLFDYFKVSSNSSYYPNRLNTTFMCIIIFVNGIHILR